MLEIRNLTKRFGSRTIIDDLSMTVKDNEIVAIVGPSGAGKTTLLRCITGLESVNTGEFYWNGTQFDPTNTTQKIPSSGLSFRIISFSLI